LKLGLKSFVSAMRVMMAGLCFTLVSKTSESLSNSISSVAAL